jgi:hypothetical protein
MYCAAAAAAAAAGGVCEKLCAVLLPAADVQRPLGGDLEGRRALQKRE